MASPFSNAPQPVFRALLAGLPDAWITTNEGVDTFSAFDNVGHLIHGERADWIPRAKIILGQGTNRRFEPWVAHDLGHIVQTSRVMAKQYRDAVGPWREYLPVLDR